MANKNKTIKFYVSNRNKECDLIREILEYLSLSYSEINAERNGVLHYLSKDLGIEKLPALATEDGIFSGSKEIISYLKVSEEIYSYLDS